jgi:hypothetical protein
LENYGLSGKPTTVFFTEKWEKRGYWAGNGVGGGLWEKIPESRYDEFWSVSEGMLIANAKIRINVRVRLPGFMRTPIFVLILQ